MTRQFYSWNDFQKDLLYINNKIYYSGWLPDVVVGIKRGGLVPAVAMSHLFQIPMHTITYQSREGEKNTCFVDLLKLNYDLKILIVDDICDTGETFKEIKNKTKNYKNIKFCSIYYNIRQGFEVDYFTRKIDREKNQDWIVFPWELIETK